jgi:signal transduction histidine kinase
MAAGTEVLRRLFQPLNLAAYVTWAAVFARLMLPVPVDQFTPPRLELRAIAMLGFLAAFVAGALIDKTRYLVQHVLLATEALLALLFCVLWPDYGTVPVLLVVVAAQYALQFSGLVAVVAIVTINVALWLIFESYWSWAQPLSGTLVYGGAQAFAALSAWYARSARETADVLQRTNAHLLATRSLLEETARDQERLRLARELHDVAGHKLTALKLNLALLERGGTEAQSAVDVSTRLAGELLGDVRAVVAHLRQHDGMDLRDALAQLVAPFPQPRVHLDIAADARVDSAAQAEALLRVVQEALTNVARHAGASNAWVSLRRDGDAMRLHVHDDGKVVGNVREGHGLSGMRERLAALGGSLELSRGAAGGLALDVMLPISGP